MHSVRHAFAAVGVPAEVTSDPAALRGASRLVLPGVGTFGACMDRLRTTGLDEALREEVRGGKPLLGICLGMQLLGRSGSEDGETVGLGLIPAPVGRFSLQEVGGAKIPHVGFNIVHSEPDSRLFCGLPESADFYFVHSYRMLAKGLGGLVATCNYGVDFVAAYENENVFATQFHPEKSQSNGLVLLKNFLAQ